MGPRTATSVQKQCQNLAVRTKDILFSFNYFGEQKCPDGNEAGGQCIAVVFHKVRMVCAFDDGSKSLRGESHSCQ